MPLGTLTRSCVLALALLAGCRADRPRAREHEFVERHMGCAVRVVVVADTRDDALAAAREAFAVVARVDAELSDWRADSLVSELARRAGDGSRLRGEFLTELVVRARELTLATDGAFDVAIGPLVRVWRAARRDGTWPDASEVERARTSCDPRGVDVTRDGVELLRAGMTLDFGGIGKGFAADRALARLRELGFERALVGIEGDLALGAPPPGRCGWRVRATSGEAADAEVLELSACGVSTSGDTAQFFELGGRHLSHVLDPRTGRPVEHGARATVIARDATDADAFATAFHVLGAARSLEVARARGLEARVVERGADGLVSTSTPGYARHVVSAALASSATP